MPKNSELGSALFLVAIIPVVHCRGMGIRAASQSTEDMHHKKAHPLFLVGIESLIERRPGISELFESGSSLSQGIGASTHEFNRINLTLLTELSLHRYHPVVPCLCPGSDGFLYGGPKFFLLRCQLQRRLDYANSRVGQRP